MTLADHLARRIATEGPISLAAFMAEALGHPRFGYYMTRDPLGTAGDFTTAPEISQMFGELLGLWCADCWMRMGAPEGVRLIELGPGRGTLMADALRAIGSAVPALRRTLTVHLVEMSPVLRQRQRDTLGEGVVWHDRLEDVPDGPTLLLANEFFDALPVHQFQRVECGWAERLVALEPGDDPRFRFVLGPPSASNGDAPPGTVIETCPAGAAVARTLAERLGRCGGAALIVDYGYAGPATGDTVQAMRGHAFAPVLDTPGEADITAHVDFTALARAALGAEAYGPVEQGALLTALGIRERASALSARADEKTAAGIAAALQRLTADDAMGRLFRALALTAAGFGPPAGFA